MRVRLRLRSTLRLNSIVHHRSIHRLVAVSTVSTSLGPLLRNSELPIDFASEPGQRMRRRLLIHSPLLSLMMSLSSVHHNRPGIERTWPTWPGLDDSLDHLLTSDSGIENNVFTV
jgi:hypothetical protein